MPKILIKEIDRTSPGAMGDYSNYAVLLVGFQGTPSPTAQLVECDTNGVYEFTSAEDFKNTIGLYAPKITKNGNTLYHYGNQMAYELLNIGYKVLFKPITSIVEITKESFWDIFKDKANYDFRFISHGLLSSEQPSGTLLEVMDRMAVVKEAIAILNKISVNAEKEVSTQSTDYQAELAEKANEEYQADYYMKHEGFRRYDAASKVVDDEEYYADFAAAVTGTSCELSDLEATLPEGGVVTEAVISEVNGLIADLAMYNGVYTGELPGRGDCVALIELDESTYVGESKPEVAMINATNGMTQITHENSKYCALTVPSVVYKMSSVPAEFEENKKFPGAFHYLACFANSLQQGFAEWYAAAGYTRGVSSYTIDHTTVRLGEIAINALEPRYKVAGKAAPKFACNVIANFRGSYYLWGNRTAFLLYDENNQKYGDLTASSFLNIRHLCATIKKQLYVSCRRFTFDPNSDTLWVNFVNAIKPTLERMKADQGIRDYKILKVFTDKKATLKAKVRIIPIEAVEDFDLEVSLEDSFGETTAVVTE